MQCGLGRGTDGHTSRGVTSHCDTTFFARKIVQTEAEEGDGIRLVPMCTWMVNKHLPRCVQPNCFSGRPSWIPELLPEPNASLNVQEWIANQISLDRSAIQRLIAIQERNLQEANRARSMLCTKSMILRFASQFPFATMVVPETRIAMVWSFLSAAGESFCSVVQSVPKAWRRTGRKLLIFLNVFPMANFPNSDNTEDENGMSLHDEVNQPEVPLENSPTSEEKAHCMRSSQPKPTNTNKDGGFSPLTVWKGCHLQDATWEPITAFKKVFC